MIPVTVFAGRKVAVFGLGMSGVASARALAAGGAEVAAWDDGEAARDAAAAADIPIVDLRSADWSAFGALVLAPGVPLTHPQPHWTVTTARAAGVEIIGDTELFFRQKAAEDAGARVAVVTGTNGKSTTSALIAHLVREAGVEAELGGNIGTAVLDLAPFSENPIYVLEFSSFQIDLTPSLAPDVAVLLNITADHLDRHGSLSEYAAIKARVFAALSPEGCAVIGVDDAHTRAIANRLGGPFVVSRISAETKVKTGVYAEDATLHEVRDGRVRATADLDGVGSLRGAHNWQNAAAAFAAARGLGLDKEMLAKGLRTFPGLAHRMEEVGTLGDVLFINDSKATNADAASKALASFERIYWIAGGRPKAGGLEGLDSFYPRIAHAYLIGEAGAAFAATLEGRLDHTICGTLERAVTDAARDAGADTSGDAVVLFSPACSSFDQFPNFVVRGNAFRDIVSGLDGIAMKARDPA